MNKYKRNIRVLVCNLGDDDIKGIKVGIIPGETIILEPVKPPFHVPK